ncbi:conjugal transfer protein TraG N-terminal domain-containing protein [Shewanella sp. UCD-KL12]|uniref:conjugal transfer protein TraG N-terminal domain-containing protein n=1 Tax=Shewanella sp. UCD-KL12 TaxID=1917163 RepID=UPI000970DB42|nr:conjugal transfer protein TraG N-terminal domain-containing protein [Shewanella sp. UCD-KL12]
MGSYEIFSVGNPAFLIEIFTGISRLWSSGDIYLFLGTGLILGLIWSTFQWAIDQDKSPFPAKGFILSIILVVGLLGPQSLVDVTVISKRDNSFQDVSNVPLLPAFSGWLITNSVSYLADGFAQAFSIVGVDNTWSAFSPIQHFVGLASVNYESVCTPYRNAEKSYNICKSMNLYLNECYTPSNLLEDGKSEPIEAIFKVKPADLMATIQTTNKALQTTYFLDPSGTATQGVMSSCTIAYAKLDEAIKSPIFNDSLDKSLKAQGIDLNEVQIFVDQQTSQGTMPDAESSLTLANAMFLKSQFVNYFPNSNYGNQVARGMFDTANQRHLANAQKKEYWMENAEIMQSFFEALAVFLTPFIGLMLAISSKGLMAVGQYMMVWVFVQMWTIMIVLVNGFMGMAMTGRFTEGVVAGESVFSLTAIDSQFASANSYISMGGMLYTFIPAICVFVMYRGVHAMQGMASKSMADPSIKAERFAPDTGATMNSGNASFGNHNSQYMNNIGAYNRGDNATSSTAGDITAGGSVGAGATSGQTAINKASETVSQQKNAAIQEMFQSGQSGSSDFTTGSQTQSTVGSKEAFMAQASQAIAKATGMDISEAQRLVANGNVEIGAGGQLGFNKGGNGVSLGAKAKVAMGVNDEASQSSKESFSDTLKQAQSKSKEINAALSQIQTAGDSSQFTESAQFAESTSKAAQLAKQESVLQEQSASVGNMNTASGQISQSAKIDTGTMTRQLDGQSIEDYLKSVDPKLWEQISNSQIQTENGMISGEKYLENQTAERFATRDGYSATPYGEAKAYALMDYVKQNDGLDVSGKGVDFDKEMNDNSINKGIFNALQNHGVEGAAQASDVYENREGNLQQMQSTTSSILGDYELKDVLGEHQSTADIAGSNQTPTSSADKTQGNASGRIDTTQASTANGQAAVVAAHSDGNAQFEEDGQSIANVGSISEDDQERLNNSTANLHDTHANTAGVLGGVQSVAGQVVDHVKGDAAENMNEFIVSSTNSGTIPTSVKEDYADGMEKLSDVGNINTKVLENGLKADDRYNSSESFEAMIGLISDQEMVDSIVGKDGNSGSTAFTTEQKEQLSAANQWFQNYSQSGGGSSLIDKAIEKASDRDGDVVGSYLNALDNRGMVSSAMDQSSPDSSISEGFSSIIEGEKFWGVSNDLGVSGSGIEPGTYSFLNHRFDEMAVHAGHQQSVSNQLGELSDKLEPYMSEEQKTKFDSYMDEYNERFETESISNTTPSNTSNVGSRS